MTRISVRLRAAYMEEPVMIKDSDIFRHFDIQKLPISVDLKNAVQAWDDDYQATFDADYPPDSGFASPALEAAHNARGSELAKLLQLELGKNYSVEFKT